MILQYKGFNNNWVYEEADIITHAVVSVEDITSEYSDDTIRGKKQKERLGQNDIEYSIEYHKAVNNKIMKETQCDDEIIYLIGDLPFNEMKNVCVVMLKGKNKYHTYVFHKGVYLLNNNGSTVMKLA